LVDWAMRAKFQSLIEHGVKIFLGCRPFDHSKLLVVDDAWILVGSSNWDQRSLRLNFEANLECYDVALAGAMEEHFQSLLQKSELVSLKELQSAPFRIRLRNNIARVFTPYL
jgi:cardiolipin synthase